MTIFHFVIIGFIVLEIMNVIALYFFPDTKIANSMGVFRAWEKSKQDEKLQEIHDAKEEIAWGSQIRSYVLQPYQLVKDHRINLEVGNVNAVLDGDIDPFINGVLLAHKAH